MIVVSCDTRSLVQWNCSHLDVRRENVANPPNGEEKEERGFIDMSDPGPHLANFWGKNLMRSWQSQIFQVKNFVEGAQKSGAQKPNSVNFPSQNLPRNMLETNENSSGWKVFGLSSTWTQPFLTTEEKHKLVRDAYSPKKNTLQSIWLFTLHSTCTLRSKEKSRKVPDHFLKLECKTLQRTLINFVSRVANRACVASPLQGHFDWFVPKK